MIDNIKRLSMTQRVLAIYALTIAVTSGFVYTTGPASSILLGATGLGFAISCAFYDFQPAASNWRTLKAALIKTVHLSAMITIIYLGLWGTFIQYGSLLESDIGMIQRTFIIIFIGAGWLAGNIVAGRGRFFPESA